MGIPDQMSNSASPAVSCRALHHTPCISLRYVAYVMLESSFRRRKRKNSGSSNAAAVGSAVRICRLGLCRDGSERLVGPGSPRPSFGQKLLSQGSECCWHCRSSVYTPYRRLFQPQSTSPSVHCNPSPHCCMHDSERRGKVAEIDGEVTLSLPTWLRHPDI